MVSYIIPEYVKGLGNCTKMKDITGEHVLSKTVKSALKSICSEKMIDLRIAKRRAEKILGQSNLIPIYLNNNEIYVPVRTRRPRVIRDGGYGYINFCSIKKIMDKHILLKDNSILDYIESKRCLMKRYKMAGVLLENLCERDEFEPYRDKDKEMKSPATREDILFLLNEIGRLRRIIEKIV